jgi:FkbM family methyltransferase
MKINELNLEYREAVYMNGSGNWLWPKEDVACWKYFNYQEPNRLSKGDGKHYQLPHDIIELLPLDKRNLIFQAGGNGGLYPSIYAEFFKQVITFEPHYRWFTCLAINAPQDNVFKYRAAIGNDNEPIQIVTPVEHLGGMGAMYVQPNGLIPKLKLDSFGLNPDLIHLDIEGAELSALQGAVETIKRAKPLIVLEWDSNTMLRFNYSTTELENFFKENNYVLQKSWPRDRAYVHESNFKQLI